MNTKSNINEKPLCHYVTSPLNKGSNIRSMKDSGIQWIGQIPENWKKVRFKYTHNTANTGESIDKELCSSCPEGKLFYTAGLKPIYTTYEEFPEWKYTCKDDLLLARNGTPYVYLPEIGAVYSDHIIRVNIKNDYVKKYVRYCLQNSISAEIVDSVSLATWSISLWNQQVLPLPPIAEQTRIANFLDQKCSAIDSVLEKTRASIEEYKMLKQSIITQAVTKGIRPNRQMKDSGIEWIGQIPEDWKVIKFKYLAIVKSNLVEPSAYVNYPQVSPENIEKSSGKLLPCKTVKEVGVISDNHLFYKGQILYSKIRPKLNKVTIAPFDGLCSADMYPIETTHHKKFFLYALLSGSFLTQISFITEDRVKMPKINQEELGNTIFPIPPLHEQQAIADYLDTKCTEIDNLIAKKEQFLKEIETYKKSLIYEYITGKKEVL